MEKCIYSFPLCIKDRRYTIIYALDLWSVGEWPLRVSGEGY